MLNHNIGKIIKHLRKKIDMSQEELAEKTGLTNYSISNWERALYEPKFFTVECILDVLGYEIKIVPKEKKNGRKHSK